jgi:hypothetical protein
MIFKDVTKKLIPKNDLKKWVVKKIVKKENGKVSEKEVTVYGRFYNCKLLRSENDERFVFIMEGNAGFREVTRISKKSWSNQTLTDFFTYCEIEYQNYKKE